MDRAIRTENLASTIIKDTDILILNTYPLELLSNSRYEPAMSALNKDMDAQLSIKTAIDCFKSCEYSQAEHCVRQGINVDRDEMDNAYLYNLLAKIYLRLELADSAITYLQRSASIANQNREYILCRDAFWLLSEVNRQKGQYSQAMDYLIQHEIMRDSAIQTYKQLVVPVLQKGKCDLVHKNNTEKLSIVNERNTWKKVAAAAVLLASVGGCFALFKARWRYTRTLALQQNMEILENKVDNIKKTERHIARKIMKNLQIVKAIGNSPLYLTGDKAVWDEFYGTLDAIYPDFRKNLKTRFHGLTEKDIQLCCLERAWFETGEIAFILQVQPTTIRMRRTAIRKKIGITTGQDLNDFFD